MEGNQNIIKSCSVVFASQGPELKIEDMSAEGDREQIQNPTSYSTFL